MLKYVTLLLANLLFWSINLALAQENNPVEMADTLRSSGKIYVVVAVIITLFSGILLYLISLDRKLTRLENETRKG